MVLLPAPVQDHRAPVTGGRAARSGLQCVPQPAPGSYDADNSRSPPVFAAAGPGTLPSSAALREAVALLEPRWKPNSARLPVLAAQLAAAHGCPPPFPSRSPPSYLHFFYPL